jgi:two-component system, NarL family, nitrate/nitrite sensor histidine kinase NarX
MFHSIQRSLLLRMGFALALIAALALFGIVSSVIIAETLRGEATAINRAGALRMQTYSISTDLLQPRSDSPAAYRARVDSALDQFDSKFRSEALTRIVPANPADPARMAYEGIGQDWESHIRPRLLAIVDAPLDLDEFLRCGRIWMASWAGSMAWSDCWSRRRRPRCSCCASPRASPCF